MDWWGLKRRQIAYRNPTPIRPWEAGAFGALLGIGLVAALYVAAIFGLPDYLATHPTYREWHYLLTATAAFFFPIILAATFPVKRLNEHSAPWESTIWAAITHLRDDRYFMAFDWFLRLAPAAALFAAWKWLHMPWSAASGADGLYLVLPLAVSATLCAWSLAWIREGEFFVRHGQESDLDWLRALLASHEKWRELIETPAEHWGVEPVPPDAEPTFLYVFSHELPEKYQNIGVHLTADCLGWLRRVNEAHHGRLFAHEGFSGAQFVVRPWELPGGDVTVKPLRSLIAQIASRAAFAGWSRARLAAEVLAFIQREIRYESDAATKGLSEYGRFPLETLRERRGDCECMALLCAALLAGLGFESALILVPGHAAVGLRWKPEWVPEASRFDLTHLNRFLIGNDAFLYGETTCAAKWGEVPTETAGPMAGEACIRIPPSSPPGLELVSK